jgi:hypothetical protein
VQKCPNAAGPAPTDGTTARAICASFSISAGEQVALATSNLKAEAIRSARREAKLGAGLIKPK